MNRCPSVVVVVPAYNSAGWIAETLRSALGQRYPHDRFKIVVVDDGSTDDTTAVAEAVLRHGAVAYRILHTTHGGPSHARNAGWRASDAEWIQFLDADDLLHPDKLKVQTGAAALAEDVAVIYSDWQRIGLRRDRCRPRLGEDVIADLLAAEHFISTGSQLYRRSWLERVGGWDERHRFIEDVDLLLRVAMQGGRFVHAPSDEPLFSYRVRRDSLSHSCPRAFVAGCVRNARLAERYWTERGGPTTTQAQRLAEVYVQGIRAFAEDDPEEARRLADALERLAPAYLPRGPWSLRLLARLVGFRRAEAMARRYRRLRQWAQGPRRLAQ